VNGRNKKELIAHISSDIETLSTFLTTFRIRVAFIVVIGPFVVLGSFLVAKRGDLPGANLDMWQTLAATIGIVMYLVLSLYGALLEAWGMSECNKWRKIIAKLSTKADIELDEREFELHHNSFIAYLVPMFIMMVAFLAILFLVASGQTAEDYEKTRDTNKTSVSRINSNSAICGATFRTVQAEVAGELSVANDDDDCGFGNAGSWWDEPSQAS
jgi:hypothetical protein